MRKTKGCATSEVIIHGEHNIPTLLRVEGDSIVMRRWDVVIGDWGSYTIWKPLDIKQFLKLIGETNKDKLQRRDTMADSKLVEAQKEISALRQKLERIEREHARELGHRRELQEELKERERRKRMTTKESKLSAQVFSAFKRRKREK